MKIGVYQLLLVHVCVVVEVSQGFSSLSATSRRHATVLSTSASAIVDDLFGAIDRANNHNHDEDTRTLVQQLEDIYSQTNDSKNDDNPSRFEPLLGLYNVSSTLSSRQGDNPVGGKWTRSSGMLQKILQTTATWQHLLPTRSTKSSSDESLAAFITPNNIAAEAVNHIRLEAFNKLFPIHVLLRGDVVPLTYEERTNTSRVVRPLSSLAVKVLFDAPRICFGNRWGIHVGPKTSVLLDTTYCDNRVRIGMGGTSGTRFVFARSQSKGAEEYKALLQREPIARAKALIGMGVTAMIGGNMMKQGWRLLGGALSLTSLLLGSIVSFSSGGIERDDQSVRLRQEYEEDKSLTSSESMNVVVPKQSESGQKQPKYIVQSLNDEALTSKYASIESLEDRAYQILLDLGMLTNDST
jgi:hypothetical protein